MGCLLLKFLGAKCLYCCGLSKCLCETCARNHSSMSKILASKLSFVDANSHGKSPCKVEIYESRARVSKNEVQNKL